MAYAALVSLIQTIYQMLSNQRYPISVNGKHKIESIEKQSNFLQDFLEKSPNQATPVERRIRDAANEAQNIIEHFMYEQNRVQFKVERAAAAGIEGVKSKHLHDFHEMKRVHKDMNSIVEEVKGSKDRDGQSSDCGEVASSLSTAFSSAGDDIVVGFDEDLEAILEKLCSETPELPVLPIVGMGGIGKTTLARKIYNSEQVMREFDIRGWVTVSQEYDARNVMSKLVDSMNGINEEISGEATAYLAEKVYKCLKGRRYLIVLDDVWGKEAWDDLRAIFPEDGNGSRIIITTRLEDLAAYAASSSDVYKMQFLNPDESWYLLGQKVFKHENFPLLLERYGEEIAEELEKIMREIARSCGLPLAIVLIAGMLSSVNKTQDSWKGIVDYVVSAVATKEQFETLLEIMYLSYTYLPHHLRLCFLYMGCFPKDYEIYVSKLIKLWIAEGFVKPTSDKSLEESAEKYLEELVKRSLVLVTGRKSNGKIKTCSLHDQVRELSIRRAQDENFKRRLSISHADLKGLSKTYGSTIRSIICFQPDDNSLLYLRKFKLLRVLDVVNAIVYSLPAQVFELFHLRYLAFGCPMKIPAAISMLQNLYTLVIWPSKGSLHYPTDEVYLPMGIWTLPLLRHLVSFYDLLPDPEEGAALVLENLHTLSVVKRFVCSKKILARIPNLKKLRLTFSGEKLCEAQLNNLVYLHKLETLKLIRNGDFLVDQLNDRPVFPQSLKKLTLSGWHLPWGYMNTVGSLPKLEVLKLRNHACKGENWETTEGEFASLSYLLIDRSDLQVWTTESSHFPRLKCLVLYRCSLKEIPESIGEIPTLQLVEIDQANKSLLESAKVMQEEQLSCGNEDIQVRSVRYHYQV